MAKETSNFGFQKPEVNEFYDIGVQNANWDKADAQLYSGKIHPNDVISAASEVEFDTALLEIVSSMPSPSRKFIHVYSTTDSFLMGGRLIALITKSIADSELGANATVEMFQTTNNGALKMLKNVLQDKVSPMEYVNPPMIMGEEYRTTERHNGKAVYCKYILCGKAVNGLAVNTLTLGASKIIRHESYINGWSLPLGTPTAATYFAYSRFSTDNTIVLYTDTIADGYGTGVYQWHMTVWYTKD